MINCETDLDLSVTKDCVFIQHYDSITGTNFMITSTKPYAPVVILLIIISNFRFTPCKAEQALQDMELQEKEAQKS